MKKIMFERVVLRLAVGYKQGAVPLRNTITSHLALKALKHRLDILPSPPRVTRVMPVAIVSGQPAAVDHGVN